MLLLISLWLLKVYDCLKKLGEIKHIESELNFADVLTKNVKISIFETLGKAILNGFIGYEDKFQFSKHQRENV